MATDQVGRQLTQATSRGTRTSDHQELIGWARLRWHLHDLDPERAARLPTRHLEQRRVPDELEAWLAARPDSVQVGIVRELVGRCRALTLQANELQAELSHRVARVCPRLLSLPGCGVLTAAKILAEVAGVGRFGPRRPWPCTAGQRH